MKDKNTIKDKKGKLKMIKTIFLWLLSIALIITAIAAIILTYTVVKPQDSFSVGVSDLLAKVFRTK
ncbi:hypothetical protein NPA07_03330 [Mycoplasmopsis caviae]|uniref:Uncharacterized protein n=1 Tax=Mycoplasmopsis caviae TaxID=55603 RepID=A0A3P8KXH4_9BACT|nr:hypothetical protein [Mycoplasmopsis caviae]UUD34829.1 hypothetical protein NPA07_03330 [Mycoplasmopsis caviae]VDR42317.1 Uncharacterised protein [Mycoplasmopsis caviae]